jgi:Na+/H+ antiporter NhaD/arsenite permease-like protein
MTSEALKFGEILSLWSVLPFAGMLLSIALFPLAAPRFWHDHFGKISAFWSLAALVPLVIMYKALATREFLEVLLADYLPFVILLFALYAISGGVLLRGRLAGRPIANTGILLAGTLLASWMGTTGAAMLLIRPFLRANAWRKERAFMVVFFIFLVANVGGALTPLGDPPLFLGFLKGVPFFWTFKILPHMLLAAGILIFVYWLLDSYHYKKENLRPEKAESQTGPAGLAGARNLIFLAGVIGAVLISGFFDWGALSLLGVHRGVQDLVRDAILIGMGICSVMFTPPEIREENEFTWFPMREVAILFAAIFITMAPCLRMLQAGPSGELAFLINAVTRPGHYFWATGVLSSFLDNAPTYLTFLNTALGSFYPGLEGREAVRLLIREHSVYLEAISAGAVFFGAMSYIGNAPNFMVRSIAEESGVPMPGFFGYMIKYSLCILGPVFILITLIFF